jgi:hypothetical protein
LIDESLIENNIISFIITAVLIARVAYQFLIFSAPPRLRASGLRVLSSRVTKSSCKQNLKKQLLGITGKNFGYFAN